MGRFDSWRGLLGWLPRLLGGSGNEIHPAIARLNEPTSRKRPADIPFDTLLAEASDFDLIDGTYDKILLRYDELSADQFSPEERVIILSSHSWGIIDNGGFEFLFAADFIGDLDYRLTAETYHTIGLDRGYQAFQAAFKLFPGGRAPRDRTERIREYKLASEEVRLEINKLHWSDGWEELRNKKLADFIRANAEKLGDLDSIDHLLNRQGLPPD
jgi:hypothetical protein